MSDINVIGKNLINAQSVNVTLKDTTNLLRPSLELVKPVLSFNYFYIPAFYRYYFVDDKSVIRHNFYRIVGRVDVLESYKQDILNSYGLVLKNKVYNPYYGNFETELRTTTRMVEFENNFNENGQIVLITVNGGDNISEE